MSRLIKFKYQTDDNKRYLVLCSEFTPTLSWTNGNQPNNPVTDLVTPQPLLMRASRKGNPKTQAIARHIVLAPLPGNSRGIRSNIEVVVFRRAEFGRYRMRNMLLYRGDEYRVVKGVDERVP